MFAFVEDLSRHSNFWNAPDFPQPFHEFQILFHLRNTFFLNSSCVFLSCVYVRVSPVGLLNLEELLRQFLISKETLSVRMLDDSQDPTPLLKEIRDDKTATIIVDANATMSHVILERVRTSHPCDGVDADSNLSHTSKMPVA